MVREAAPVRFARMVPLLRTNAVLAFKVPASTVPLSRSSVLTPVVALPRSNTPPVIVTP